MVTGRKIGQFIDYLQSGGEIMIDGRTYVWLDNYPTCVIDGVQYGIDGLAMKGISIKDGFKSDTYMGASDMDITFLVKLVSKIDEKQWLGIHAFLALKGMDIR